MSNKNIAIACQGGGSHTAFTAGVLHELLLEGVHEEYNITELSGTSARSAPPQFGMVYSNMQPVPKTPPING